MRVHYFNHTHLPLPLQSMLEDKLLHSDWDATCEAVEQAVARESYLLWLREQEKKTKGTAGESSRLPQVSEEREREREREKEREGKEDQGYCGRVK